MNNSDSERIEMVQRRALQLTLGKQTDLILLGFSKVDKINHLKLLYNFLLLA